MLEAAGIGCRRGGRTVFDHVDLRLERGEALLLRGANGTGKTSLLRILAGFLTPVGGSLGWAGQPISDDLEAHRNRVHFLGFNNALQAALTARENLLAAAGIAGGSAALVDPALEMVGLLPQAELPVRWLSTGQRRRLGLARLLVVERPLWLLDEPEAGLDRASTAGLEAMIAGHRARGGIAVLASHRSIAVDRAHLLDFGD